MSTADTVSLILGIISYLGCLFYWTGRWYKQLYFQSFNIPYESVEFNHYYYIFHSWCTVSVALCLLIIILNIIAAFFSFFYPQRQIIKDFIWLMISILFFVVVIRNWIYKIYKKIKSFIKKEEKQDEHKEEDGEVRCVKDSDIEKFLSLKHKDKEKKEHNGGRKAVLRIIQSWDLLIIFLGFLLAFLSFFLAKDLSLEIASLNSFISKHVLQFTISLALFLWIWFGIVGYKLAEYHAESAKAGKKMGIQFVTLKNKDISENFYFIVRASEDRNFIYQKDKKDEHKEKENKKN
ncbi:MAG: hypothetical protein ACMUIU_05645 [bacterium]